MNDELGKRIKDQYESRSRTFLPRRTYTILRLDGKSFHQFCKHLIKPFDVDFISDMNETTLYLCKQIQGCKMGYVQSDEISLLLTDFEKITTDAWFDGNVQKMVSVSASYATSKFNQLRFLRSRIKIMDMKLAEFDSRAFTIPDPTEVENYFVWRQKDCMRNSISMVAQSNFSHKELQNKSTNEMQEMLFQKKGINWNNTDDGQKRGRLIVKEDEWKITNSFDFLKEREKLTNLIPKIS